MKILRNILELSKAKTVFKKFSSAPKGWNRTTSDLMQEMEEGSRSSVGQPELTWALEYERSLIPKNYRFPQMGDLYASLCDQEIEFMTAWSAPFTGGGKAILYAGEQVWIMSEQNKEKPIGSYAQAVEYKKLEQRMVSAEDRNAPDYGNFYFYFNTVTLNENFKLVQTGFEKSPWK